MEASGLIASSRSSYGAHRTKPSQAIVTLLDPRLRSRLDLASRDAFLVRHLDCPSQLRRAIQDKAVRVVLLSPCAVADAELGTIADALAGFAGSVAVAITDSDSPDLAHLLQLGACGAKRLVNLDSKDGFSLLRDLAGHAYGHIATAILRSVMPAVADATPDTRFFFERLVLAAPMTTNVRVFARSIDALPSTLMSRFFRAQLPSPKRYLAETRILYAAALFETPRLSIAEVANRLAYSSPQSFGRHLRERKGLSANDFRYRVAFSTAIDRFITELITPYEAAFRSFVPLNRRAHWHARLQVAEP